MVKELMRAQPGRDELSAPDWAGRFRFLVRPNPILQFHTLLLTVLRSPTFTPSLSSTNQPPTTSHQPSTIHHQPPTNHQISSRLLPTMHSPMAGPQARQPPVSCGWGTPRGERHNGRERAIDNHSLTHFRAVQLQYVSNLLVSSCHHKHLPPPLSAASPACVDPSNASVPREAVRTGTLFPVLEAVRTGTRLPDPEACSRCVVVVVVLLL